MKKFFISLALVLIVALVAGAALAAGTGLPGSGWWSGEQIQNVGTGTATISVTAYEGTSTYSASQSVAPGSAYTFTPNDFSGMASGFQGAAVVSSDQPIKAVVNITNRPSGSLGVTGGKAAAQYQGIDSSMADTTLYFPIAKGDSYGKTTTYYIQNTGTAATTATATFKMRNGDTHTYTTPSIQPNQMVLFNIFDTTTYTSSGVANDAKVGAVTVVSNGGQPLAGILVEHYTTEAIATIAQSTRAFTSADFDTTAYAPIIKNNRYGRSTGIQVQNVSGGNVDITVTYKGTAGACAGQTYTDSATGVADGTSHVFNQMPGQTTLPENCTASATISATGNIVALVSESYLSSAIPSSGQASVTSFAIPGKNATTTVSAPLFKDDRYGKRTGLQVQNVGTSNATNVVATFACSGGATFTAVTNPITIPAGSGYLFYTPSDDAIFASGSPFSSNNVNCSVTITADQPIVALANESVIPGGTLEQDNNNYEAFNLP
ncbi:MAG: hypothetical protein Fur0018_22120 [Anaerolineales bacterium]